MCPAATPSDPPMPQPHPTDQGVTIKCLVRRSPRSIDPEFDPCLECIVGFATNVEGGGASRKQRKPLLHITPLQRPDIRIRQRSFGHPPLVPLEVENRRTHSSGRLRSISRSSGGGERFSVVGAIGCGDKKVSEKEEAAGRGGELEMDDDSEGEWVGGGGGTMVAVAVVEDASRAVSDGESNHHSKSAREEDGFPPITPFNPNRHNSPLVRELSNISRTPSRSKSESFLNQRARSSSRSRSRSRSRIRGAPMTRKRSMGAASAYAAFADSEIDRNRSLTPLRQRGCSLEDEALVELQTLTVPLGDVISVDQEIPCRRKTSSAGSDFFSSVASETGSSGALSPPPPSNSLHGKSVLYRIFLHTSSKGYIEFSFDNPNSHDILMAFLSAHLKPDQLPRKTPTDQVVLPIDGALQTMILTPTKLEKRAASNANLRQTPPFTRSASTDSACTLEKLQKKIIQQRIQQETTALEKIKENLASWMSSIVDCACCQDTTVVPDQEDRNKTLNRDKAGGGDMSPTTEVLQKNGIGGLSFEEAVLQAPKLSFEASIATDRSGMK